MGNIHFRAGNLEKGLNYLVKAVSIYRQLGRGQESNSIAPLFMLGNIHNLLQQSEDAHLVWTDAYETAKSVGDGANNVEVCHTLKELLQVDGNS